MSTLVSGALGGVAGFLLAMLLERGVPRDEAEQIINQLLAEQERTSNLLNQILQQLELANTTLQAIASSLGAAPALLRFDTVEIKEVSRRTGEVQLTNRINVKQVIVKASTNNTATVFLHRQNADSGYELSPGDSILLNISNPNELYLSTPDSTPQRVYVLLVVSQ